MQLFRREDFGQLVERALAGNKIERSTDRWKQCLEDHKPRKQTMTIADSIQLIKKRHRHNDFLIETATDGSGMKVTAALEAILSKKLTKKNTIVFLGASNRKIHHPKICIRSICRCCIYVPRNCKQFHV